jgi:rubrerythrin
MLNLAELDRMDVDGAVRETAEEAGLDRSTFLRRAGVAGAGLVAGGALFSAHVTPAAAVISTRRKSRANDIKILNFALTLEFLEAEFYRQAVANNAFANTQVARFGQVVAIHEANHAELLAKVLGSQAISKPSFDFGATVTDPALFQQTAQSLEDTGVRAYLGQINNVLDPTILATAGRVVAVEARHAAWIRFLNGGGEADARNNQLPAFETLNNRNRESTVLADVKRTGFIKG